MEIQMRGEGLEAVAEVGKLDGDAEEEGTPLRAIPAAAVLAVLQV